MFINFLIDHAYDNAELRISFSYKFLICDRYLMNHFSLSIYFFKFILFGDTAIKINIHSFMTLCSLVCILYICIVRKVSYKL